MITTIQGGGLAENYQNTVNLLIKAGANVYSRQDGKTALQWAEERRQLAEKGGYKESAANIVALLQPSSIKQSLLSVINTKTDLTLLKILITNAVEELEKLNDVVTLNEQQLQTYIYYKEIFLIFAQRIAKEIIRALYTHHPGEYKSDVLEAGDLTTKDIFIPKDVSSVIITKGIINHYNDKLYDLVLRNVRGLKYVNQQTQKEELKPDITFAQKVEENIKTMLAAFIIKEK